MITKKYSDITVKVTISYPSRDSIVGHANGIRSIEIRGDLPGTTWEKGLNLINGSIMFELPLGQTYRFKFVITDLNGGVVWEHEPSSDGAENDGYGGVNSILSTERENTEFLQGSYF